MAYLVYFEDFAVGGKQEMPDTGYVVVRCDDGLIVARLHTFPVCERALMYRRGELISFMPLKPDEIVGTPSLFAQMFERSRPKNYPPGS